ncbi:MAG: ATP-binding protein [Gammaproteobacteria bacterium]
MPSGCVLGAVDSGDSVAHRETMSPNVARSGVNYLGETLAIALLYVATAELGFALAPGNVTLVWPPSGIALAAVLVRGYRAGLGIGWGAMLVNLMFFSQAPTLSTLALTKASSIATGCVFQAMLAAGLYRRVIGFGVPVATKDILDFIGIAALSCTVAATVSTITLAVTGAIPWGDWVQTGWTWWLGDLAGILTLTPLLLFLSQRPDRGIERVAFPVISLGFGLTLIAFYTVWLLEDQAVATRFERAGWLPWSTLSAGLLFTALLAVTLHRYAQTAAALRAAHHESEQRVRFRTNALKPAIATLRAEIAQRRRVEKQLRKKEAIFRTFLNSTPAMMWMTNRDGRCIFFNNAWLAFVGRDLREALALVWTGEEIHPDDLEACMATYRRAFRDHTAFQHQYRVRAKNGAYRWVFEIGTPFFDTAGRYEGIIGTASDVTERLEVEHMKDEFLSIVSHELRTPLTSIRGALGLLATGALGRLNDKGGQMLTIAVKNTERLVRLINDTLDLERMESGRATLDVHTCDAGALIGQARDLLQPLAEKAGVTLVASCPSLRLRADPDRIVQILTNLLSNAIKFSEPGARVCVSAEASADGLVFRVQDQGRGIPVDKLEVIFERFQQVDASDSRQKGGTGLGLAICRKIVQQHGGRIWVESELGRGSAFCFAVPAPGTPVDASADGQDSAHAPTQTKAA